MTHSSEEIRKRIFKENLKRARKKWRKSLKGRAWDRAYNQRDYVKEKARQYYYNVEKLRYVKKNPPLSEIG